jgi:nucleotide-binding universal stress UspA family protein
LTFSSKLAASVHGRLELLHVVGPEHCATPTDEKSRHCETCSRNLRDNGIHVNWTLLHGTPDQVIPARSAELKASLIVMSIGESVGKEPISLNQALINTIRKAHCPVLTVPSGQVCNSPNHTVVSPRSM